MKARLLRLHGALVRRFEPQGWRPGNSAYGTAVAAVLWQNTAWTNAARAVAALRSRRLLEPGRLLAVPESELVEIVRCAGSYRLKACRLREFTRWLLTRFRGRFDGPRRAPLGALRTELLAVPGLGPETVDAILLYAAERPVFVADASVRRVLARHRLIPRDADYEATRTFLEAHLPSDPSLFSDFHALLVAVSQSHCRVAPSCEQCPLRADLRGRAPARV